SFSELAKKHSDDKGSAEKDGDLGYFNKGKMVPEFEKAAFDLKLNAYTKKPVKSAFGYHIILKTGEKDKAKLKDVKDTIIKDLSNKLLSTDAALPVNAMIALRKSYGFKIEDSNINKKYSSLISNQLLSLKNNANQ
ncbi:MAG: peptidylprolyl isomerase, partial [Bacilli bacterium]|nr:peptidylprolyl isomerase [Bacilli bacterium]